MTTKIGVRFATLLPVEIEIRRLKRPPEHKETQAAAGAGADGGLEERRVL